MVEPMGRDALVELLGLAAGQGRRLGMRWELPDGSATASEGIPQWTNAKAYTADGHITLHDQRDGPTRFFVGVATITRVWRAGYIADQLWP